MVMDFDLSPDHEMIRRTVRDFAEQEVAPVAERHLRELLAWAPYEPTPDYPAKPEPGRIRIVTPSL